MDKQTIEFQTQVAHSSPKVSCKWKCFRTGGWDQISDEPEREGVQDHEQNLRPLLQVSQ